MVAKLMSRRYEMHLSGEITMDWNRVEGNWKQLKGKAKQQWGRLTEDDLTQAAGRREELAGKIQERYGVAKDAAQKQVDEWENRADASWLKPQKGRVDADVCRALDA